MSRNLVGSGTEKTSIQLEKLFGALGNATRILILRKLARFPQTDADPGGMYPGDLADHLLISKQGVMKHLEKLKEGGLVKSYSREIKTIRGPQRFYYRLTPSARNLLSFIEEFDSPTGLTESRAKAREKLDQMNVTENLQPLADLERKLIEIDDKIGKIEQVRQELMQVRHAIIQEIRGEADKIIRKRFTGIIKAQQALFEDFSIEREILHSFFGNPVQCFLEGFQIDDFFESIFAATQDYHQRRAWEDRILRFFEDIEIIKKDKSRERFFFFQ